jgi:lipopolysaccharide transport system ATP-binding protein
MTPASPAPPETVADRPVMISVRGVSKRYVRGQDSGPSLHGGLAALARLIRRRRAPLDTSAHASFWALDSVSFDVRYGERVGIIGRNGAGKSTLLKILSRVVYPSCGEVRYRGRLVSLLEVGTGFHGDLTGRENTFLNASIHGLTRAEIDARFASIVAFADVGDFLDTPVKRYSRGMHMRLAFAVAVHLDPDILILDEVLSVGDAEFQRKCLERVESLVSEGRTLLFVSHSASALRAFCDRCIWLDEGRIRADGPTEQVLPLFQQARPAATTATPPTVAATRS